MHVLRTYRDQLTSLRNDQFVWEPYPNEVLSSLPTQCTAGHGIWRSVTYLIGWSFVEPHLPHRVLRQFGMRQTIPLPLLTDNFKDLHKMDRRGRAGTDWTKKHEQYIDMWNNRYTYVFEGQYVPNSAIPSPEYLSWYVPRTVVHISKLVPNNPHEEGFHGSGSTAEYMIEIMTRIRNLSTNFMERSSPEYAASFAQLRDISSTSLDVVRESHRLDIEHQPIADHAIQHSLNPRRVQKEPRRGNKKHHGGRRSQRPSTEVFEQTGYIPFPSNEEPPYTATFGEASTFHPYGSPIQQMFNPHSMSSPTFGSQPSTSFIPASNIHTPVGTYVHQMYDDVNEEDDEDEDEDEDVDEHILVDEEISRNPLIAEQPQNANVPLRRTTRQPKLRGCGTHGKLRHRHGDDHC